MAGKGESTSRRGAGACSAPGQRRFGSTSCRCRRPPKPGPPGRPSPLVTGAAAHRSPNHQETPPPLVTVRGGAARAVQDHQRLRSAGSACGGAGGTGFSSPALHDCRRRGAGRLASRAQPHEVHLRPALPVTHELSRHATCDVDPLWWRRRPPLGTLLMAASLPLRRESQVWRAGTSSSSPRASSAASRSTRSAASS